MDQQDVLVVRPTRSRGSEAEEPFRRASPETALTRRAPASYRLRMGCARARVTARRASAILALLCCESHATLVAAQQPHVPVGVHLRPAGDVYLVASSAPGPATSPAAKTWKILFQVDLPAENVAVGLSQTPSSIVQCVIAAGHPNLACASSVTDGEVSNLFHSVKIVKLDSLNGIKLTVETIPKHLPGGAIAGWLTLLDAFGVNIQSNVASARCVHIPAASTLTCSASWWSCAANPASPLCTSTSLGAIRMKATGSANGETYMSAGQVNVGTAALPGEFDFRVDTSSLLETTSSLALTVPNVPTPTYCLPAATADRIPRSCYFVTPSDWQNIRPFDVEYQMQAGSDLHLWYSSAGQPQADVDSGRVQITRRRVVALATFGNETLVVPVGDWHDTLSTGWSQCPGSNGLLVCRSDSDVCPSLAASQAFSMREAPLGELCAKTSVFRRCDYSSNF